MIARQFIGWVAFLRGSVSVRVAFLRGWVFATGGLTTCANYTARAAWPPRQPIP